MLRRPQLTLVLGDIDDGKVETHHSYPTHHGNCVYPGEPMREEDIRSVRREGAVSQLRDGHTGTGSAMDGVFS